MAGDTRLFQEALKRGSAHAWNEQWDRAAEEYRRALRESPEDISARTYLAMALYKSGSYYESLEMYQALWAAQPSNLTMLQRVAELQEAVGNREAASLSYGRLSEAHSRRRAPKEAFRAFQKVVELSPANPLMWSSLVQVAVQAGTVKEVIPGYLGFARDLALQSRFQDAIQIAERARALDPENPLVLPMLAAIRKGIEYSLRAAGFGEEVFPEDLARYIPTIDVLQARSSAPSPEVEVLPPSPTHGGAPTETGFAGPYQPLVRTESDGRSVVEIRLAPTPHLLEQGLTANSVRDSLGTLGEVVRISPEAVSGGGVVFVIVLSTAAGIPEIQKTVEQLWQTRGPEVQVQIPAPTEAVESAPDLAPQPRTQRPETAPEPTPSVNDQPAVDKPLEDIQAADEAQISESTRAPQEMEPVEQPVIDELPVVDEPEIPAEAEPLPVPALEQEAGGTQIDEDAAAEDGSLAEADSSLETVSLPEAATVLEADSAPDDDSAVEVASSAEGDSGTDEVSTLDGISDLEDSLATEDVSATEDEAVLEAETLPEADVAELELIEEDVDEDIIDLPVLDISWEEFEALTMDQPSPEIELATVEPSTVELEPDEAVSEVPSVEDVGPDQDDLELLEPIEVPWELEEALSRLEMEDPAEEPSFDDIDSVMLEVPAEGPEPELSRDALAEESVTERASADEEPAADMEQPSPSRQDDAYLAVHEEEPVEEPEPPVSQPETEQEPVASEPLAEPAAVLSVWDELVQQAEAARESGDIEEAADLYERALIAGPPSSQSLVALGDLCWQMGRWDRAAQAFGQALSCSPGLPEALLGLAAVDLVARRLDSAEKSARSGLEAALPHNPELASAAVDLLLDILRERAAYGDLRGVADGLVWFQTPSMADALPDPAVDRIGAVQREVLGLRLSEHMEEIAQLPSQDRGELVAALRYSEKLMDEGKLRLAADEMHRMISFYPDFLPSQSALGQILAAQRKKAEASERSRRLLELYALRGTEEGALEVLLWMSQEDMTTQDDQRQIARLLRQRGREAEAASIEDALAAADRSGAERRAVAEDALRRTVQEIAGKYGDGRAAHPGANGAAIDQLKDTGEAAAAASPPSQGTEAQTPRRGILGMLRAFRSGAKKEDAAGQAAPGAEDGSGLSALESRLRQAESRYAEGDAEGAASLIRSALLDERISGDVPTRVALLRVLQVVSPSEDGLQDALVNILGTLGLPKDLSN